MPCAKRLCRRVRIETLRLAPLPHLIALKPYTGGTKSKADVLELLVGSPEADLESLRKLCRSDPLLGLKELINEARSAG